MGTDDLGRDVFARVLYGGRVSLGIGLFSAVLSVIFGMTIGMVAGFFGGAIDEALMRVTEVFQILPEAAGRRRRGVADRQRPDQRGPGDRAAELARDRARDPRPRPGDPAGRSSLPAARMGGASWLRMLWRHLLPNVAAFVLVSASLQIASAIVSESFLSFLGLGDPAHPSWGLLLQQGQLFLQQAPGG